LYESSITTHGDTYCERRHFGELFKVDAAAKDRDRDEETLKHRHDKHGIERLETVREPVDLRPRNAESVKQ
jgi:hypothetical protein